MQAEGGHYRRYPNYDYSQGASLFITINAYQKQELFGQIRDAQVYYSDFGYQVLHSLEDIPKYNPGFHLYEHILMPNHLHANLCMSPGLTSPLLALGNCIRKFKTYTTTIARKTLGLSKIWEDGYHDYLCTSREFIEATARYIAYNPLKYELYRNIPQYMRIQEPIYLPRLPSGLYWKGLGNTNLLLENNPIIALRVSRSITDFYPLSQKINQLVGRGATIISGFISPGERMVFDTLLQTPSAKIIKMLPASMSLHYKPNSNFLNAIEAGRFLEIAYGNDEKQLTRQDCEDLNSIIINIAQTGIGNSLYWK